MKQFLSAYLSFKIKLLGHFRLTYSQAFVILGRCLQVDGMSHSYKTYRVADGYIQFTFEDWYTVKNNATVDNDQAY